MKFINIAILTVAFLDHVIGQTCGGAFNGFGHFSSPNYPQLYPNNVTCTWHLQASSGYYVQLSFLEINTQPTYDVIYVYSYGVLVAKYSGLLAPTTAVFGSVVTVIFQSDSADQDTGFSVQFSSTDAACGMACSMSALSGVEQCTVWSPGFPITPANSPSCNFSILASQGRYLVVDFIYSYINSASPYNIKLTNHTNGNAFNSFMFTQSPLPSSTILSNGAVLTSSRIPLNGYFLAQFISAGNKCGSVLVGEGSLTTPGYPGNYPNDIVCVWNLRAYNSKRVFLQFLDFRTEQLADFVRVFSDNQFYYKITGEYAPKNFTLGSNVTIEFVSNPFVNDRGVFLSFTSV